GGPADVDRPASYVACPERNDARRGARVIDALAVGAHEPQAAHETCFDGRRAVARSLEPDGYSEPRGGARGDRNASARRSRRGTELADLGPGCAGNGSLHDRSIRARGAGRGIHVEIDALDRARHTVLHQGGRVDGIVPGRAHLIRTATAAA